MRTTLLVNGIPSGVEPDVVTNLPVQGGDSQWEEVGRWHRLNSWSSDVIDVY